MARPKEFDRDTALDAAIGVFREHGFEGTSAAMLTDAMKIGRQSLYDTFGDKWQLYCAALQRYSMVEGEKHLATLRTPERAIDGLKAMIDRVVSEARAPCLGIGAACEFGQGKPDLSKIQGAAGQVLQAAVARRVREAQGQHDVAADLDANDVAAFIIASFASIRIAARGGAPKARLRAVGKLALRALH
jgi:AcrR family transcriptional regulator